MTQKMPRSGFTLLELLLAMALLLVLLGMIWNVIALFQRTQSRGTRLADHSQLLRSLTQLLEDDFKSAIQDPIQNAGKNMSGDNMLGGDDMRHFGFRGSAQQLQWDVLAMNPFAPMEPPHQVSSGEIEHTGPKAAELKTVFYEFRPDEGLSRRERNFETFDTNAAGDEGTLRVPEVVDCRFRYFDGSQWSDSWDSIARQGLPVAVECTLEIVSLAEARKIRNGLGEPLRSATATVSRFVIHLPNSPLRKGEEYCRTEPPRKEPLFSVEVPSPAPPSPPPPPVPAEPQRSWLRGE